MSMIEFNLQYNDAEITYSIDVLGRERVYVDKQLVAKPTNWFNSISIVEITIDNESLKLTRRIRSYKDGEYQVTLSNQHKIIEKQSKLAMDLSMSGEETIYKGDEAEWLDEVRLPRGISSCAWALYFTLIFHTLVSRLVDSPLLIDTTAWAMALTAVVSVGLFFYWTVASLVSKPSDPDYI